MKGRSLKTIILLGVILLSALGASAQILEAYTSVKEVAVGQPFDISYSIKNVRGNNFTPPRFDGFKVLSGPMQSSSTSIINGQSSSKISFKYTIQALQAGNKVIPAASLRVNNKIIRSAVLRIKVTEKKKLDITGKGTLPEIFVKCEVNQEKTYTGQQILLDYRLYTSISIQNINIASESEYEGFFFEPLRRYNTSQTQEVLNGKTYVTQLVRRIALFPQQSGQYNIEASQITAEKVVGKRRSGFFSFNDTETLYLSTDPIVVNVQPRPTDAPPSFTGGVGNDFEMDLRIMQANVTTDDAIVLHATIKGNGDIKRVQAPKLDFGSNFEIYEPKILQEENYENRGELYGKKIVEYLIIPKKEGQYQLQVDFSYFNPDSTSYQTISEKTTSINVKKGSNAGKKNINISTPDAITGNDFKANKTTAHFSSSSRPFFGRPFFWILTFLPLLGLLGAFIFKKKESEKVNMDAGEMKMKHAMQVAQEKLATGKKYMEKKDSRAFYDEVSRASLGYIGDKLQIPPSEMSKSNVRQKLEALKVSEKNIEAFIKILQTCEMALFAGMDNSMAMEETYQNATKIIANIEEEVIKH